MRGRYKVVNDFRLREKAGRTSGPRHQFYVAMIANSTYEGCLAQAGQKVVSPDTFKGR